MTCKKEARRSLAAGRATHKCRQIVTRDRVDIALAILIGSAIMFGALLTEAIGL